MKTNLYIQGAAGISTNEPDYKEFIQDAGLRRRMSRVIRMSVASAMLAMREANHESFDAIVTGTGWGCLSDTEKFLVSIINNDERLLNPSSFIQSTSNTVGAQIALMTADKCYNSTYVHGSSSFESALADAHLLLKEGKRVVLAGGFDELTPTKRHLLGRMGMWRSHKEGEGAAFFVLTSERSETTRGVIRSVEICGINESTDDICSKAVLFNEKGTLFFAGDAEIYTLLKTKGLQTEDYKVNTGEFPTASALGLQLAIERLTADRDLNKVILVSRYVRDVATIIEVSR